MQSIPHELAIGGVYFPPLLIAGIIAAAATWLTAIVLNHFRLSRFLVYPPLIFLALFVLYTGVIGSTLVLV